MYVCVCVCDVSCFCASLRLLTNIFEWGKHQMRQSSCHCRHWPRGQAAATTKNQRKFSGKVNKFLLVCFHSLTVLLAPPFPPRACHLGPRNVLSRWRLLLLEMARNGQKCQGTKYAQQLNARRRNAREIKKNGQTQKAKGSSQSSSAALDSSLVFVKWHMHS